VTVLAQVPVERITAEARQIRFWHTVLTLIGALLILVGRCAYWTFAGLWLAVTWCAAAVKVGWQEARAADARRRAAARAAE
jgi:hypothetical protein